MRTTLGLLASALLLVPASALAHARLTDPTPRFDPPTNPGGIKQANAPCGAAKPAAAAHTYTMGTPITIKVNEVIDHPGHYELWWSNANDATFTVIPGMNNIPNPTGKADTSVQLTLPNMPMDNATLQLIMVMTENPAAPTNYYSCADIKLVATPVDMAGQPNPDLAIPADQDLANFNDTDDLLGADMTMVAGAGADMSKKPPADSAGPACSVGGGPDYGALALVLLAIACVAVAPGLRRRAKQRS